MMTTKRTPKKELEVVTIEQAQNGWQPISTLPGSVLPIPWCLMYRAETGTIFIARKLKGNDAPYVRLLGGSQLHIKKNRVTHWMPLPDPPPYNGEEDDDEKDIED